MTTLESVASIYEADGGSKKVVQLGIAMGVIRRLADDDQPGCELRIPANLSGLAAEYGIEPIDARLVLASIAESCVASIRTGRERVIGQGKTEGLLPLLKRLPDEIKAYPAVDELIQKAGQLANELEAYAKNLKSSF